MVKQVSIFMENRSGRMYEITNLLGENGINIRALSLADTSDFGILRLIVDDSDKAIRLLKGAHYTVSATQVLAIEVPDRPGGLAELLKIFYDQKINIEYMYAFLERKTDKAVMTFRFDHDDEVREKLQKAGVVFLSEEMLSNL